MDKLDEIFSMQSLLDGYISRERELDGKFTQSEWIQKKSLALIDEVTELLNEVNYKWWKNPKPVNERAVKEEIVDILHFFVSICLTAGMTADELYEIYCDKNCENIARQQGKSQKSGYELNKK
ncbi:MAG: dUTPase [Clostridia bacterium]|nr:dUTPase [Clostridia bacterium]